MWGSKKPPKTQKTRTPPPKNDQKQQPLANGVDAMPTSPGSLNFTLGWVGVNIWGTPSFWNTLNGQYLWLLRGLSHATGPTLLAGTDSKVKHSQPVSRVT